MVTQGPYTTDTRNPMDEPPVTPRVVHRKTPWDQLDVGELILLKYGEGQPGACDGTGGRDAIPVTIFI